MKSLSLASPIVFDNDCLASFLWTGRPEVPRSILPGKLNIPEQVVREMEALRTGRYAWVYNSLLGEIRAGRYEAIVLPTFGPVATEYIGLATGVPRMGAGEAAVLATVRCGGGTVASNNLSDVSRYCAFHGLELITTVDIMCLSVIGGHIALSDAINLWEEMKKRRRRLPPYDFSEALRQFREAE